MKQKKAAKRVWDKSMNPLCLAVILMFLVFMFISWSIDATGIFNLVVSLLAIVIVSLVCCRACCD